MEIGLYTDLRNPPQWQRPWQAYYEGVLDRIADAEEKGIGSIWLSEHHFFEDGYLPQPLTFAAAIAARTRRIRIGTAVLLAPLRPAVDIAEQGALVDILSGGRLELGLGAGYRVPEFTAFGVDVSQRFSLLEDRAREIRRLWDEGVVTPGPLQNRPPIWLGVHGPRGGRIAGRLGEGLLSFGRAAREGYARGLAEAGHDAGRARMASVANLIVSDDPERAWTAIAPHLAYQWQTYARYGAEGADGIESTVAGMAHDLDPEDLRSPGPEMAPPHFDVVTPEEAVSRLTAWVGELPVTDVFFWDSIAGMSDEFVAEHIELLATKVGPALAGVGLPVGETT
jgi:alkanesulfonate monooxygenase SsuD/methylene tetrahydromethanopterin reductase-like flavin-dependent oxidoreductase (luciferase family)